MVSKSCRDCGQVTKGSICTGCQTTRDKRREQHRPSAHDRGYDSEYRKNRLIVIQQARQGRPCVICGRAFKPSEMSTVTAEHIKPLRDLGTSSVDNLGPAHPRCNYGWNRKPANHETR